MAITVLAATGFTGKLVCEQLTKLGVDFYIAGRSSEKLRALAATLSRPVLGQLVVDVQQEADYAALVDVTKVLINCAGPFTDLGLGIVKAAAQRGVHYLDTTGEQAFIKQVADQYDQLARTNQAVLISGCAFEYALGDAAAVQAVAKLGAEHCTDLSIYYSVAGFEGSRGTKKSVLSAIEKPYYFYEAGRYRELQAVEEMREVTIPGEVSKTLFSFGGGEVLTVPRQVAVDRVSTFIGMEGNAALLRPMIRIIRWFLGTPIRGLLTYSINGQAEGPGFEERQQNKFAIMCEAKSAQQTQRVIVKGNDSYGITAVIISETARQLLAGKAQHYGFTSVSQTLGRDLIVQLTKSAGYEWTA
jgi:short subunit dehydrogenase-like uncharacterized protein